MHYTFSSIFVYGNWTCFLYTFLQGLTIYIKQLRYLLQSSLCSALVQAGPEWKSVPFFSIFSFLVQFSIFHSFPNFLQHCWSHSSTSFVFFLPSSLSSITSFRNPSCKKLGYPSIFQHTSLCLDFSCFIYYI